MRDFIPRSAIVIVAGCLFAGGCATDPFSEPLSETRVGPATPIAVTQFTQTSVAARSVGDQSTPPQGPRAAIKLVGAQEMLPPPQEAPSAVEPSPGPTVQIDLGGALGQVAGQNPRVAFAQAQIQEAFARLQGAEVLWLPNINAGVSYNRHDGGLQQAEGQVDSIPRQAMESGLGVGASGTGSPPVAGLSTRINMGDAIFAPKVLRNELSARQAAFTATLNDTLQATALAYIDLLDAYQQRAISQETVANAQNVAQLAANFAKVGITSDADSERTKTELAIRRNELERAKEAIRVTSARLMELLNLSVLTTPEPVETTVVPIGLVAPEVPLPNLIAAALSNRPELAESRYLVAAAVQALRQQQFAPLIPSLLFGVSESNFGGGHGSTLDNFQGRFDLDAIVYWELRNLGFGEVAARSQVAARVRQARFHELQIMDQVAREVAEDFTQAQSKFKQITIAEDAVRAAVESYKLNLKRFKGGAGLPIEMLQSVQALDQARHEYLRAVTEFDRAQFRLFRDLGWMPQ